ncbi:uncharacterized protein LOC143373994 isoform X2 [Andrena cerasifolii]|uniref:uncharacterized protein LOC143373994 isoform X2 n=1 Tax=Andrena cerasifolii TaxID=2819439 RepID=UPI00403772CD
MKHCGIVGGVSLNNRRLPRFTPPQECVYLLKGRTGKHVAATRERRSEKEGARRGPGETSWEDKARKITRSGWMPRRALLMERLGHPLRHPLARGCARKAGGKVQDVNVLCEIMVIRDYGPSRPRRTRISA